MTPTRRALAFALLGAITALLVSCSAAPAPAPVAAPAPLPAAAGPAPVVTPAPPTTTITPRATTTTTRTTTTTTTTTTRTRTAAECERIALRSDISNAELRPYLRSIGCDDAADGLLVGAAEPEAGENACGPGLCGDQGEGQPDPSDSAGRDQTSGESQYEYGCEQGYITEGC